ncbi:MAG: YraN family protein [Firmicutes bacterium]|nr:YraN family protein [Bacillota bacterium]
MNTRTKGNTGEDLATDFLIKNGFTILARNYCISKNFQGGEIDIVALKNDVIHFIEVKSRNTDTYGSGAESVGFTKQKNIRKIATHFLTSNKLYDEVYTSLDIIEVTNGEIDHIENCF